MSGSLGQKFREIDVAKNSWKTAFDKIRTESASEARKFKASAAKLPSNNSFNRYVNVLPYDHSIVKLENSQYINANHIRIKEDLGRNYILAQGPLPQTSGHFWQMVWEQKTSCIIMLTRVIEQSQYKCHMYFPGREIGVNGYQGEESVTFGEYQIDLKQEHHERHYSKRLFDLKYKNNSVREINHFQFNTWPDFGVPEKTDDFLEFLSEIRKTGLLNGNKFGPVVCHCSAGIGRSGTFILADTALAKVQKTKDPSKVDIKQMVIEYRRSRVGLIQTPDQLRFAWKSIVDALDSDRWKGVFSNPSTPDGDSLRIATKRPTETPSPTMFNECMSPSSPIVFELSTSIVDNSSPKRPKPGPNLEDSSSIRSTLLSTSSAATTSSSSPSPSPVSNKSEDVDCSTKSLNDVDASALVDRSR